MSRRDALAKLLALGVALGLAPVATLADQPTRIWRVGVLVQEKRPVSIENHHRFGAFAKELRRLGYIEGDNLVTEWRFADGVSERLPALAAELVRLKVDVIVAATTPPTAAARKATSTIPIVMASVGDPVGSGFVANLAHPGGNITGFSNLTGELGPKYLELLLTLVPQLSRVAVLINPGNSTSAPILKDIEAAAQRSGVTVVPIAADNPKKIDEAFYVMLQEHAGAFITVPDALFVQQAGQIAKLAIEHRLPSMDGIREAVYAGGLMSYGQDRAENYRLAATYVDKILKGVKVSDLPVVQATKFEIIINSKTARALGIVIPQSLLLRADQVIE